MTPDPRTSTVWQLFGWFDSPQATIPARDPGLSAPCPFCSRPVRDAAIKTISVMPLGAKASYFYRAHKACYESAEKEQIEAIEGSVVDIPGAMR